MPNTRSSQTQFKFQAAPERVYRVGPGLLFTTVQSAINQAVTDGFNNGNNPVIVEVYDKGSAYVENLTLQRGVYLRGVNRIGNTAVPIQGNHSLSLSNADPQSANRVFMENIVLTGGVAGSPTLLVSGTANTRLMMWNGGIQRIGVNDGQPALRVTNTNNSSQWRFVDASIDIDDNTGTAYAVDLQRGQMRFYGGLSGISGATNEGLIRLTNNAALQVLASAGGNTILNPVGTALPAISIESATASVQIQNSQISQLSNNATLVSFTANGQARFRNCQLFLGGSGSKLGAGTTGQMSASNCFFLGDFGTLPYGRNAVDPGIQITEDNQSLRVTRNNGLMTAYVGNSGFPTIQAALDYLAAATYYTGQKRVLLSPGNYTENVTVPDLTGGGAPTLTIQGDTDQQVNVGINDPFSIIWNGNINWSPTVANMRLWIMNIYFNAQGGSPWLKIGGNAGGGFTICHLQNISTRRTAPDAQALIEVSGGAPSGTKSLFIQQSDFQREGSDNVKMIDLQEGTMIANNSYFVLSGASGVGPKTCLFLDALSGSNFEFRECNFYLRSQRNFRMADQFAVLDKCHLLTENGDGEVFYYTGQGNVRMVRGYTSFMSATRGFSVARQGTLATGALTVNNNSLAPGALSQASFTLNANLTAGQGVNVNGLIMLAGTDFAIGVDANATALNMANFINTTNAGQVAGLITAQAVANVVNLSSTKHLAATNAYTLAVVSGPITVSGANFTGGLDADGFTIAGQEFRVGDQFQLGVDADATAENILQAINGTLLVTYPNVLDNPNLQRVVFGVNRVGNVVNLSSYNANNANSIATVPFGPQPNTSITFGGATLSGAVPGSVGSVFAYDATFTNSRSSSSDITTFKYQDTIET